MRTIFTKICTVLFFTLLFSGAVHAQNNSGTTTYSNANYSLRTWDIGLNIGATWLQSDINKNYARLGWGFTVGKYWLRKSNRIFDIGLRFRYLAGNARGIDYTPNFGLKHNTTLNGDAYPELNYYSDSTGTPKPNGHVYNNYKMLSEELSLELMLGFNRLRQKTGILFYVFGGGGFFYNKTTVNQLDASGNMYDYSSIDPSAGSTAVINSLDAMMDDTYETVNEGKNNDGWVMAPTLGIGLGKMLSKSTAIGFEHKITFPLHDYLDGMQWTRDVNPQATGTNDWQHYTGFYIRWYFRAAGENRSTYTQHSDPNNFTQDPPKDPKDPIVTNPPPPPPPSPARPNIIISYPTSNPFNTNTNNITVTGFVQNVNNRSQITVKVNGFQVNNFSFDPQSKAISVSTLLNQGSNNVDFYAVNNAGSDQKTQYITYSDPNNFSGPPPVVTFTNPGTNPYNSSSNMVNVVASVINVNSSSNISVKFNGIPVNNFTYNVNSKVLTYTAMLNVGSNSLMVTGTNQYGSDSKTLTMTYNQVLNVQPPVVTITYPASSPHTVVGNSSQVNATVLNVNSKNSITINANGSPVTNFNYNMNTKVLDFTMNMNNQQSITIVITATNQAGSDTKSTVLLQQPKNNPPPLVTITSPNANPYTTTSTPINVAATVINVNSQNEISVMVNNMPTTNFSYNMSTKQVQFTTPLNLGSNLVTVSASNANGSDSKTQTIIYNVAQQPPVVNITTPPGNPATATGQVQPVKASVTNITSASQCNITLNGSPVTNFTYNAGQVTFNANLNEGSNTVSVTATNSAGSDTETKTINYQPKVIIPRPIVTITNPTSNPYNTGTSQLALTATVQYVNSQNEITVVVNNTSTNAFSYNMQSKVLNLNTTLNPGNNTIKITATNSGGTDSKTQTVVYTVLGPPVITYTNPATPGLSVNNPNFTVTATVTNITSQSQIQVFYMVSTPVNFTYNPSTKVISFPVVLSANNNVYKIVATNQAGSDTELTTISYTGSSGTGTTNGPGGKGGTTPNNGNNKQGDNNNSGKGGDNKTTNNGGNNVKTTTPTDGKTTTPNGKGDGKTVTPPNGKGG